MSIATALLGAAVVGGGASLITGEKQASGSDRAAALSAAAQDRATGEVQRQFDLTRTDFAPYRETGTNALLEFGRLYGVGREGLISEEEMLEARERFKETPGYDFRFGEGIRARDRSAAARGKLRGGGYGRELTRYGQGIASDEFGNYSNALARLAGVGQSATGSTAAAGQSTASNLANIWQTGAAQTGNAMQQSALARASGYAGIGNMATSLPNNFLLMRGLERMGG